MIEQELRGNQWYDGIRGRDRERDRDDYLGRGSRDSAMFGGGRGG